MKCNKLLKTKKGQIVDISSMIGNFLSMMPGWLKAILFLFMITFLAFIITLFFGLFGYHCDSQDNVYSVPFYSFLTNLNLLFNRPALQDLTQATIKPQDFPLYKISGVDCLVRYNGTTYYDGAFCTGCDQIILPEATNLFLKGRDVCEGDVFHEPDKGYFKKKMCDNGLDCDIPKGYFYNQTSVRFQCEENSTFCTGRTVAEVWNDKLKEHGSLLSTPGTSELAGIDSPLTISCSRLKPTLKLFGIPLFDPVLWIFFTVLTGIMVASFKIWSLRK